MHRFMMGIARLMALLGGTVLSLLIILTCLSIVGRELSSFLHSDFAEGVAPGLATWLLGLGIGPINGDFELVEAGVAFAIFAFIPLCQITSGHASVDIFVNQLPGGFNKLLRVLTEIVFALVLILIAWRLYDGMQPKMRYGETTFLLQFPIWWAYAASFLGAVVSAIVGVYMAFVRLIEVATGRVIVQAEAGAEH